MRPQSARRMGSIAADGVRRRCVSGFTLVELLIVLAILSLLSAVVFPVFRACRVSAQRTVCSSNMHQDSVALSLYSQDYDDNLPSFRADPSSAMQANNLVYWHDHFCRATRVIPQQVTWVSLVAPYVAGSQTLDHPIEVFHCPADTDRQARPLTSYEYKMLLAAYSDVNRVPDPAEMALLWEQWAYHIDSSLSEYDRRAVMNVLFVDGHVRWTRLADTTTSLFGNGPDMHWIFVGTGTAMDYTGSDVIMP